MKFAVAEIDGDRFAGVVVDDSIIDLSFADYDSHGRDPLLRLLQGGLAVERVKEAMAIPGVKRILLDTVTLMAPILRPPKIVAVGFNYLSHSREVGTESPSSPLIFSKFPSSVIGPDEPLYLNRRHTDQADWEVELAVVMGNKTDPNSEVSMDAVFGYTVANDITARELQNGEDQWVRSKSLDGFCPLGPVIVTVDEIPDPQRLALRLALNGEVMQQASTADMVFSVADILRWVGSGCTLEPGDVVLTGTPPGVGASQTPPRFLRDGDVMSANIRGIGTLRTPVVDCSTD